MSDEARPTLRQNMVMIMGIVVAIAVMMIIGPRVEAAFKSAVSDPYAAHYSALALNVALSTVAYSLCVRWFGRAR